jgi:hypothetical protein
MRVMAKIGTVPVWDCPYFCMHRDGFGNKPATA